MRLPCEWLEYSVGREIQTYSLTCPKAMNKLKPTHKKKSHARIRYARGVRGDRVGAAAAGARGARTRHKGLIVGVHRSIGGFRVRVGRERERDRVCGLVIVFGESGLLENEPTAPAFFRVLFPSSKALHSPPRGARRRQLVLPAFIIPCLQ